MLVLTWLVLTAPAPVSEPSIEADIFSILEEEEQIVVTAGRTAQKNSETTLSVEVITANDIQNSGVELLPELLRRYAGMDVAQTTFSDFHVSVRGNMSRIYTPDKVLLLIDGRPMTNDAFGSVPWNNLAITLDLIERIEIVRGPGTAMYGGTGVMGVVNIVSKATPRRSATSVRFAAGALLPGITPNPWPALSLRLGQATISDDGKHEFSLALGPYSVINESSGVFDLHSPAATNHALYTYNASPTQRLSLSYYNTGSGRNFITTSADRAPSTDGTGMLLLGLEYFVDPRDQNDWSLQARTMFSAVPLYGQRLQTSLSGAREVMSIPLPIGLISEFFFRTPLPGNQSLTVGADGRVFMLVGGVLQPGGRLAFDASAFAIDQVRIAPWMLLEAAMRVGLRAYPSGATPTRPLLSPRLGLAFPFHPRHSLRLSAAFAQRAPSPLELFAIEQLPTMLQGNPALKPENMTSIDLGYDMRFGVVDMGVTPFIAFYDDLRERAGTAPQQAQNLLRLFGTGGELTATLRPARGMEVRGNYSLALYFDGTGLTATGPAHRANLVFDTELPYGMGINAAMGYVSRGDYWGPSAETFPTSTLLSVAPRFYADISLRWHHRSGMGLQLSGQNLNRFGPLLRSEYPAIGAQAVSPRIMLAFSYDSGERRSLTTGWQTRWYGQLSWAIGSLALMSLPIALPFVLK